MTDENDMPQAVCDKCGEVSVWQVCGAEWPIGMDFKFLYRPRCARAKGHAGEHAGVDRDGLVVRFPGHDPRP